MTTLIIFLCLILLGVVAVQIGKLNELTTLIRGQKDTERINNNRTALWLLIFLVVLLVGSIGSAFYYKNYMLGYGPHVSASEHGGKIDFIFNITLVVTGIVYIITQIALFWFSYKYKLAEGRKALYIPHDNKLEIIWTIIPAVVMALLVVSGLDAWNDIMADIGDDEDYIEIEATGFQFGWELRYPGNDGLLGARDYKLITATNSLGQDWTDAKNHDDFKPDEIVLPVGKKVRVRITSKDVLHNFYLPHFRVKMDAVPGMPTYFVFTPTMTTEEYRESLSKYPEYNVPRDPEDPDSPLLWESFNYELACAELCGQGHYSMRRLVRIVSDAEYKAWLSQQNSYYLSQIRNSDQDPFKGQTLPIDGAQGAEEGSTEDADMGAKDEVKSSSEI
jgi:cytochrome c oxidase subunit II